MNDSTRPNITEDVKMNEMNDSTCNGNGSAAFGKKNIEQDLSAPFQDESHSLEPNTNNPHFIELQL